MLDEKAWLRRYTLALSAERPVFDDEEGPARALSQSVAPASSDVPMRPVTVGSFNLPDADSSPSSGSTSCTMHSVAAAVDEAWCVMGLVSPSLPLCDVVCCHRAPECEARCAQLLHRAVERCICWRGFICFSLTIA